MYPIQAGRRNSACRTMTCLILQNQTLLISPNLVGHCFHMGTKIIFIRAITILYYKCLLPPQFSSIFMFTEVVLLNPCYTLVCLTLRPGTESWLFSHLFKQIESLWVFGTWGYWKGEAFSEKVDIFPILSFLIHTKGHFYNHIWNYRKKLIHNCPYPSFNSWILGSLKPYNG